ncbi:MAG: hypothetical protein A2X64_07150 [Ignavibacteria bacterium GWF2_33_9]|nr:MAG: hypothetical protein A2X64_07150 [Ignavibacteria bacterium GWF2_33_9]
MKNIFVIMVMILFFQACDRNEDSADCYGNFEATDIIISAEGNGKILSLNCEEGDIVKQNQVLGYIDTVQLVLQKEQIEASIYAITSKVRDVQVEVNVLNEKRKAILVEKERVIKLFKDGAATSKQMDEVNSQIDILDKQIDATRKGLTTTNSGILAEIKPLQIRLKQVEDQLQKCKITVPINGTILNKFAEQGEFTVIGKPLLKIANLDYLILKGFISETQLAEIKIGQKVTVRFDDGKNSTKNLIGKLINIANQAEFTPKIIQTKDERVNLVYAVKIKVQNDGSIKIGMPAEAYFKSDKKK